MGKLQLIVGTLLVTMWVVLAGCTGDDKLSSPWHEDLTDDHGEKPEPALPAPSAIRTGAGMTSGVFRNGSQYLQDSPHQRVMVNGKTLAYTPYWNQPGLADAAYAIYAFDSNGYTTDDTLHLGWQLRGDEASDLWIGLANFTRDRWDWFTLPDPSVMTYDAGLYSLTGRVYAVVICLGSDVWDLKSIRISTEAPPAVLSVSPVTCAHGTPVAMTAELEGAADTYEWNFGGGATPNTSTDAAPVVVPGICGEYQATLTVGNAFGADEFGFQLRVTGQLISGEVKMADAGGLADVRVMLEPGPDTADTDESGKYVFYVGADGSYTVTPSCNGWTFSPQQLQITIAGEDATERNFTAFSQPEASLTGVPLEGVEPLGVSFDASASLDPDNGGATGAGITRYLWDWTNDGVDDYNSGTDPTVYHLYTAAEDYVCRVSAQDDEGYTAAATVALDVVNGDPPYFACGTVRDAWNIKGIGGVTVSCTGISPPVESDANGNWQHNGLYPGVYIVTPYKTGWWFDPASRQFTVSDANMYGLDFVGDDDCHITGWCRTGSMQGISSVTIGISGGGDPVTTDATGNYLKTGLATGEYTVTPDLPGWDFTPASRQVAFTVPGRIQADFTGSHGLAWRTYGHDNKRSQCSQFNGPATGSQKWLRTLNDCEAGFPYTASMAIGMNDVVYVAVDDKLFAVNPDSSLDWSLTFSPAPAYASGVSIDADGNIYYTCDYTLYVLDGGGTQLWSYTSAGVISNAPAIADDNTVYMACWDGWLRAVQPPGSLSWQYGVTDFLISSPAIADDGTIVFTDRGSNLYAVAADGQLQWSYCIDKGLATLTSPAISDDGTIYFATAHEDGNDTSRLYAHSSSGSVLWIYSIPGAIELPPAIGPQGTIYLVTDDSDLYAIDPSHNEIWHNILYDTPTCAPIVSQSGIYQFAERDIAAFDASGTPTWSKALSFNAMAAAIGTDGTIYCAGDEGHLIAIGPGGS